MFARFASVFSAVVVLSVMFIAGPSSRADIVNLGSGSNTAHAVINFADGEEVLFNLQFNETSLTGTDLLRKIDTASPSLSADIQSFSFGDFVNGITYTDIHNVVHTNSGYGGGENWWHYWVRDTAAAAWVSPLDYGSADRVVTNGTWDGWVYGNANAPRVPSAVSAVPLPASAWMGMALIMTLAAVHGLRKFRRAENA